jgi:hypothetical protein
MSSMYSKAKICGYKEPNNCDLSLEPGYIISIYLLVPHEFPGNSGSELDRSKQDAMSCIKGDL